MRKWTGEEQLAEALKREVGSYKCSEDTIYAVQRDFDGPTDQTPEGEDTMTEGSVDIKVDDGDGLAAADTDGGPRAPTTRSPSPRQRRTPSHTPSPWTSTGWPDRATRIS